MDWPSDYAQALIRCLRAMDAEALSIVGGKPTGLCWYQGHLQSTTGRSTRRHEESWFPRVRDLLHANFSAVAQLEKYFDGCKRRYDIVAAWPSVGDIWTEFKGAWPYSDAHGLERNKAYRKHLHSAAEDIVKLESLGCGGAVGLAFVLVGFEAGKFTISEPDINIIRAGMSDRWREFSDSWDDIHRPAGTTRVWLWVRSLH